MRTLKLSLGMIFNPVTTFRTIQYNRGRLKAYPALLLLLLIPVVRLLFVFTVHYPLQSGSPDDVDFAVEIAKYLVPIVGFIFANFCVTSLMNGQTLLRESLIAGAFCMMPYILFSLPLAALSHIMALTEGNIFGMLEFGLVAWCVLLTFISVRETNDYSVSRTVAAYLLIVFSVLLILAITLLVYALLSQLLNFFAGLYSEIVFNIKYR